MVFMKRKRLERCLHAEEDYLEQVCAGRQPCWKSWRRGMGRWTGLMETGMSVVREEDENTHSRKVIGSDLI